MSGLLSLGFIATYSMTFSSVWNSYVNIKVMVVVCLLADKHDLFIKKKKKVHMYDNCSLYSTFLDHI